jgi:hypothetical protein
VGSDLLAHHFSFTFSTLYLGGIVSTRISNRIDPASLLVLHVYT